MTIQNRNYAKAVAYLKGRKGNIFLTGAGGTGKSYTTRLIIKEFKNPIVLGTTGLAAVNIGGETMHSFFRLGINSSLKDLKDNDENFITDYANKRSMSYAAAENILYRKLSESLACADLIVLDEVSMATSAQLEMILYRIEKMLGPKNNIPFLFVGDLLQLPPVQSTHPIFESPFWKAKTWTLTKVYRTTDKEFYRIQRKVRWGIADEEVLSFMRSKIVDDAPTNSIILAAHNKTVDAYNELALENIQQQYEVYEATVDSAKNISKHAIDKFIKKDMSAPEKLVLKIGARVMVTHNAYFIEEITGEKVLKYYNGQVGTYCGIGMDITDELYLKIRADDGSMLQVTTFDFEHVVHKVVDGSITREVDITVKQFPVRLAYALTIHKSQGQTLDNVHINCRNVTTPGQFYVALSRCSSAEGLTLSYFNAFAQIRADSKCKKFYGKP